MHPHDRDPDRPDLTWSGVIARRMDRHALAEPATDLDPADVAARLCGVHAQVLSAAELSIGRRIAGAALSGVQCALWQQRTLVKTFGPSGRQSGSWIATSLMRALAIHDHGRCGT